MPIKKTIFTKTVIPQLNPYAKMLVLMQFNWMSRYFTMGHRFNSQDTFVDAYYKEFVKEQHIKESDILTFTQKYPEIANSNYCNVLKQLRNELTDSKQTSYCREVFNRMSLYISNAIKDRTVSNMLDNFIDEEIDVILSDSYNTNDVYGIKTINVKIAGTLSSLISECEMCNIKHLVLTGFLNGSDIKLLLVSCQFEIVG